MRLLKREIKKPLEQYERLFNYFFALENSLQLRCRRLIHEPMQFAGDWFYFLRRI
jgi:hypothetical protein